LKLLFYKNYKLQNFTLTSQHKISTQLKLSSELYVLIVFGEDNCIVDQMVDDLINSFVVSVSPIHIKSKNHPWCHTFQFGQALNSVLWLLHVIS